MKSQHPSRSPLAFLILCLVCAATPALAEGGKNPLHDEMEALNKVFRQVRREVQAATPGDKLLPAIAQLRKHAVAASEMTPSIATKAPPAERERYTTAFRKGSLELIEAIDRLAKTAEAGKPDEIRAAVETLTKLRDKWHEELKVED